MKLTFLGAAGEVTGSQHLIETDRLRLLLDCGLFQGHRVESRVKNSRFRCEPRTLDGVVLSHAHIDHCGNLPGLFKAGYRGPIFCTPATADVAAIMLEDSARIQEEDVKYLRKHAPPGSTFVDPLYSLEDVRGVVRLFEPLEFGEWHELDRDFSVRFRDAGHILGSAISELRIRDHGDIKRVVFTGDLGRRAQPLLRDPELVSECDTLIIESTYGNRIHPPPEDIQAALLRIVNDAVLRGGRVIVPAFSLGRTQQIVYFLNHLTEAGLLPAIPVFVDSPLSNKLTNVYRRHLDILAGDAVRMAKIDDDLFGFPHLTYITSVDESKSLNYRKGPFVVIAASGMCESGRVLHHLKHAVVDERNTIVIVGFQAESTLGRRIVERQPNLRIHDRMYPLRARVEVLNGLSAHADAEDFKWWCGHLAQHGGIGRAFLVHGEPAAAQALAAAIHDFCDEDPVIPAFGDSFEV